jgi:hypothetical protein
VSRSTRLFLLAGCACILVLEAPRTLAALSAGWRGPYADATAAVSPSGPSGPGGVAAEVAAADVVDLRDGAAEPELARR